MLQKAETTLTALDRAVEFSRARSAFGLLECLVLELGHLSDVAKPIDPTKFGDLLREIAAFVDRDDQIYQSLRENEARLAKQMVQNWGPNVAPLIQVLDPFGPQFRHEDESSRIKLLRKELCELAMPRFVQETLQRFCEEGFILRAFDRQSDNYGCYDLLLDVNGALWKDARSKTFEFLHSRIENPSLRKNIFEFFHWAISVLRGDEIQYDKNALQALLKDSEIVLALWRVATSSPLSPRSMAWLAELPQRLVALGNPIVLPSWWKVPVPTGEISKKISSK